MHRLCHGLLAHFGVRDRSVGSLLVFQRHFYPLDFLALAEKVLTDELERSWPAVNILLKLVAVVENPAMRHVFAFNGERF